METIGQAIAEADHYSTRRQLLSIVAAKFSVSTLLARLPGVSEYLVREARKLVYRAGPGKPIDCSRKAKDTYDRTKSTKLSTGDTLKLSNTCRSVISSRLIHQYQSVCEDQGFTPFGESTLYAILSGCASNIRRSLSGLDNFSADGSNAFNILMKMMDDLAVGGTSASEIEEIKQALHQSRNYLKLEYRLHVQRKSTVLDHCATFAASDPDLPYWNDACADHHHDDK